MTKPTTTPTNHDPRNLTDDERKLYEESLAKWDKKLKPLTDANRRAGQITGDDLNIIIGPCHD